MAETFSPYQIDFSVKNTSKTFGFSKKKVIFKFGIANRQALADGLTGANCRGSEHEVIFTWSLNSGKRQILADGKDVHYSETGQNGWTADQVFQHHFTIRVPGISTPLRAHLITQPANRDMPQIKPFDLRINGCSYFKMSKIFELGTPRMVSRPVHKSKNGSRGGREEDAYMSPEERQAIAAAKLASLRDLNQASAAAPAPSAPEGDLINFLDDPTPAPPPPQAAQAAGGSGYFGAPPGQAPPPAAPYAQQPYSNYSLGGSFNAGPPPPQGPPPQQQSFGSAAYSSQSSFGAAPPPPAAAPAPFGQPPAPFGAPPPPQQQPMQQPQTSYGYQQQAPSQMGLQPQLSQQSFGSLPPSNVSQQSFGSLPPNQPPQPSPSNQTAASYQTYGSAPTFAQPPQQQQPQQPPPQQQQYSYGAPPPPQGYPGY